jgi:hypothetical protein
MSIKKSPVGFNTNSVYTHQSKKLELWDTYSDVILASIRESLGVSGLIERYYDLPPLAMDDILNDVKLGCVYLALFESTTSEESFYKIGKSVTPEDRIYNLEKGTSGKYKVTLIGSCKSLDNNAITAEKAIHKDLNHYKHNPEHKFVGNTECFSLNVLQDSLIRKLFNIQ